jgi:hypothetical protein
MGAELVVTIGWQRGRKGHEGHTGVRGGGGMVCILVPSQGLQGRCCNRWTLLRD